MEAWLKFRAEGVTIGIGLSIGRLVFSALNKVEWIFAIAILIEILLSNERWFSSKFIAYFIPFLILILQTFVLLPQLDARALLHIQQAVVPASNLHFYYVGMEVIKVISLSLFGILLFQTPSSTYHI